MKSIVLAISRAVARASVGTFSTSVAKVFRYMNPVMIASVFSEYMPMVHISFLLLVTCMNLPPILSYFGFAGKLPDS